MLYICVALLVSVLLFEASSGGVEAQGLTLSNVHVQWGRYLTPDGGDYTNFTVSSASLSNPNNAWLAVGLNNQNQMSGADIFVCQKSSSGSSSVSHAVANGYSLQTLSDAAIVQSNVSVVGSVFNCTFVRNNKINPKNVDLLNFYLLVAWGSYPVGYHGMNKAISDVAMRMDPQMPTNGSDPYTMQPTMPGMSTPPPKMPPHPFAQIFANIIKFFAGLFGHH